MKKCEELKRYDSTIFTATYNITYNKTKYHVFTLILANFIQRDIFLPTHALTGRKREQE